MANDNAEGAYAFTGTPPPHHEVWNVHDGTGDPGLDATTDLSLDSIHGVPNPGDRTHDTYTGLPGDGIVPG